MWSVVLIAHSLIRHSRLLLCVSFYPFLSLFVTCWHQMLSTVLCALGKHLQYVKPLREEVEKIVYEDGWSKDALAKMRKVDSFIKEALRYEGTAGSMDFQHTHRRVSHFISSCCPAKSSQRYHPF